MFGFSVNRIRWLIFAFTIFSVCAFSQNRTPVLDYHGQTIWQLPEISEEEIDIGLWSLIIAKEFDSSVDIPKYLNQLDSQVLEICKMLFGRNTDRDKFVATQMFIYKSGVWNGNHPFEYDLDDPLGSNLASKLLSYYLDTHKGNCVTMPTLFYVLMQRLDPNVPISGVNIPLHLFCRLKDRQTGDVWNFEATNGTTARNVWYIEQSHIPQKAIDSGIYMRDLSKKEYLAELLEVLIHKHRVKNEFQAALKYTDLALKLNPKDIVAIVQKCALNAELAYQLDQKRQKEGKLDDKEGKLFDEYVSISKEYEKKAFSLGWQPWKPDEREKYLQFAKEQKEKRSWQR